MIQNDTKKNINDTPIEGGSITGGMLDSSEKSVFALGVGEKLQKLVTVSVMVTDLFQPHPVADEIIRSILRAHSSVFSALYDRLTYYENIEKVYISIVEYISLIRLASGSGLISTMNREILENEVTRAKEMLERELEKRPRTLTLKRKNEDSLVEKDMLSSVSFDRARFLQVTGRDSFGMFAGNETVVSSTTLKRQVSTAKTTNGHLSATQNDSKRQPSVSGDVLEKIKRKDDIMTFLRFNGPSDMVSIKKVLGGIGTKTLQRTLGELIEEGMIVREGVKRWSTYTLSGNDSR